MKEKKWYDIRMIKEVSNMEEIVEVLGLRTQKKGSAVWMECPNPDHHDLHLTNARIYDGPKGEIFVCYACQIHTKAKLKQYHVSAPDVIGLVQLVKGYTMEQALRFLSEYYGGSGDAFLKDSEYDQTLAQERKRIKEALPSKDVLALIGFESVPVYEVLGIYPWWMEKDLQLKKGQYLEYVEDDPEPYLVLKQMVDSNPIMTMMREEQDGFQDILKQKVMEKKQDYERLKSSKDLSLVRRELGNPLYAGICDYAANTLGEYLIENGVKEQKSHAQNMFGKVKVGAF